MKAIVIAAFGLGVVSLACTGGPADQEIDLRTAEAGQSCGGNNGTPATCANGLTCCTNPESQGSTGRCQTQCRVGAGQPCGASGTGTTTEILYCNEGLTCCPGQNGGQRTCAATCS